MNRSLFALWALVASIAMLLVFGTAKAGEDCPCQCGHTFTWERGPIRREIARVANNQKEEEEEFERRIHRYAWAVSDAADRYWQGSGLTRRQLVALLLTKGKHESHWDENVCENFTENAPGAPAFGCWQSENKEGPPESVEKAAFRAAKDLVSSFRYCRTRTKRPIRGAISLYATGQTCDWEGADERVGSFNAIHWRLGRGE